MWNWSRTSTYFKGNRCVLSRQVLIAQTYIEVWVWILSLLRATRSHQHGRILISCVKTIFVLVLTNKLIPLAPRLINIWWYSIWCTYISPPLLSPPLFVLSKNCYWSVTNWKGLTLLVQFSAFSQSEHTCVTDQATTIPAPQEPLLSALSYCLSQSLLLFWLLTLHLSCLLLIFILK